MPAGRQPLPPAETIRMVGPTGNGVRFAGIPDHDEDDEKSSRHRFRDYLHPRHDRPSQNIYQKPQYLEEWKGAMVGSLSASLLDINAEESVEESDDSPDDQNDQNVQDLAWWENKRRGSISQYPQPKPKSEPKPKSVAVQEPKEPLARGPTSFKPPLYLNCGPLLRYCGIRRDDSEVEASPNGASAAAGGEFWRGSVMIVTQDYESSYEVTPTLRLFVQPIELLPPPPAELRGEKLPEEYVDPIAGIPKIGRRGETLYVKPIESFEDAKDVSMLDPEEGLFEMTRSPPNFDPNAPEPPLSFTSRTKRRQVDGEKVGKYAEVQAFRLHAERGYTFWRFNIEVELREQQQRIAYRINRGPATAFWVPARGTSMNVMFYSCNGFSLSVNPDNLTGPDPMWRDVLNTHQTRPFHVMLGGGDQIYNDAVTRETQYFQEWLGLKNPLHKKNAPFTAEMQDELEAFYLERYAMWFSRGLFGLANSQIPMVNMYDDHDIIDGFGSYPDHFMRSPVFSGLGNVAFKYYMLFQHQSLPIETEAEREPSWCLGTKPGPYIKELSRSLFMSLGGNMALLAVDCRTERTQKKVLSEETWARLMDRCYEDVKKNETQHLLVLLGVPIAYPRLVWLENILTSRLMEPVKALGRAGILGNFLNHFDGSVEVLDDLDDHWTAKNHKDERRFVIEDLQDLAADKSVRVTILSGDVHLAAVGRFYSNPKLRLAKHHDFRYMPNIISSAIANTPPPDLMADVLNRRNKIHHFDKETDEDMIPLFANGVDGKPRNNKRLLPHRNWCSIRAYQPGYTPPSTPPNERYDDEEGSSGGSPPPRRSRSRRGSLLRRFSRSRSRGPAIRPDVPREQQGPGSDRSRPPLSGGSFMRSLTMIRRRGSISSEKNSPSKLTRTRSLGGGGSTSSGRGFFSSFRRSSVDQQQEQQQRPPTRRRPDDGGINGTWGVESDEDEDIYNAPPLRGTSQQHLRAIPRSHHHHQQQQQQQQQQHVSLRGGAGNPREMANTEFEAGDDLYFRAAPRRAATQPTPHHRANNSEDYNDSSEDSSEDERERQQTLATRNRDRDRIPTAPTSGPAPPGPGAFRRTPTGLSAKQLRKGGAEYEVDVEGGLDVCLNVEVNPRDPAGITVPYRLLVPRLWHEEPVEEVVEDDIAIAAVSGVGGENPKPNPNNSSYISNHNNNNWRQPDPNMPITMSGGRDGAGMGGAGGYDGDNNARLPPVHPQQHHQHQQHQQPQSVEDVNAAGVGEGRRRRSSSLGGGIKRWLSGRGRGNQQQYRGPPEDDDDYEDEHEWDREPEARGPWKHR